jgi:hypothetical protein
MRFTVYSKVHTVYRLDLEAPSAREAIELAQQRPLLHWELASDNGELDNWEIQLVQDEDDIRSFIEQEQVVCGECSSSIAPDATACKQCSEHEPKRRYFTDEVQP